MYFQISTKDFQNQKGSFDIITVQQGIIYINSARKLLSPFTEIQELPSDIKEQLEKDLETNKQQKKEELEQERLKAVEADVEYKGSIIQATQTDQKLVSDAVTLYSSLGGIPNGTMQWITKDNSYLTVSLQDLVQIMALMGKNTNDSFIKCRELKNKVETAKTVNEIQSIKWDE